jgi:hypothetical protein
LKQEDLIVVAHDPVDATDPPRLFAFGPELQHANIVGAAVDHVAEEDETPPAHSVRGRGGHDGKKRL